MGCCSKFYYPNNNKVLKDNKNIISYSFSYSSKIINRFTNLFIDINCHKLDRISVEELFDEIKHLMGTNYKVIDEASFKRLVLISIIKIKSEVLLNSDLLNKSFFYLNNNVIESIM